MITGKANWEETRHLIETHTGPVRAAEEVTAGRNSEISVIVRTDDSTIFVKGRRADHPQVWTQEREKIINPAVRRISPSLRWSSGNDEWNLLGFEYIPGTHADYSPGSADIPKVARTLRQLQEIPCPGIEIKQASQRWAAYTSTPELLTGASLLHSDWSPGNVLVSDRAYLVDWAWPTKGAAWIDPACWLIWLIASGHNLDSAESWAGRIPSWQNAPANALDEFAQVQALMWADIAAGTSERWPQSLARASRLWASHRNAPATSPGTAE